MTPLWDELRRDRIPSRRVPLPGGRSEMSDIDRWSGITPAIMCCDSRMQCCENGLDGTVRRFRGRGC